jgi:hypothetical protein
MSLAPRQSQRQSEREDDPPRMWPIWKGAGLTVREANPPRRRNVGGLPRDLLRSPAVRPLLPYPLERTSPPSRISSSFELITLIPDTGAFCSTYDHYVFRSDSLASLPVVRFPTSNLTPYRLSVFSCLLFLVTVLLQLLFALLCLNQVYITKCFRRTSCRCTNR